ncbi:enoyl-CoA hydratase/isomerase family protein [Balneolaceae bacterium YR4-1]|uniref:Enoyl-CoA hydratase/isomerase family protein n=1 Tax=Halalkalibaculum roseum TaxID=2709311 RepID=A0A6M1T179_9BACT|nr:enoyl-CoA hydratase/isomerase family protein [Halalkalibaculum roseum]NGP75825.1 enoyl-CoA hydratase/isomerase family protein [Halalkalibaculum roseum]
MSENGAITVEIKNNIGTIEFHHPKGNSLPSDLLRELANKITEVGNNANAHVIVLRSKGDGAFCGGASFDELVAIDNADEGKRFFMGFALVLNAMRNCPKLIIVRVQGKAVGGAVGVAAAGDYTIAHESSSVKLSELALGIGPFVVGPAVQRKIGSSAFSTLSIDASNWYSAEWAREKGLYAKVLNTQEELDRSVDELAHNLANSSPTAMKELKTVLWKSTDHWDSQLEQRAEISGKLVLSDYTKNFIAEFKNK